MKSTELLESIFILIIFFTFNSSYSQGVSMNTTGIPADTSAMLDVSSTSKGILIPRMTIMQRNAIVLPATGLMVYQTDNAPGFYYYNGSSWNPITITTKHYIGESYGGGIVFYVNADSTHGLICAPNDQSSGIQWYNGENLNTSAGSFCFYGGDMNTKLIIAVQGVGNYAASLCRSLNLGNYSDWYLPSGDELNLMYTNLKLQGLGNFSNSVYWSSTEASSNGAYSQNFSNGTLPSGIKSSSYRVRAIRAF